MSRRNQYVTINRFDDEIDYRHLSDMIQESRKLIRNDGFSNGIISTRTTYIIGDGIKAISPNREITEHWKLFSKNKSVSISGTQTLKNMIDLMCRERDITGTSIAIVHYSKRRGIQLQVVDSHTLSNPGWALNTETMKNGMELSARGEIKAYHFYNVDTMKWDRIKKFTRSGRIQVLHSYRPNNPSSFRGVPLLSPCIDTLYDLRKYRKSVINAAILSSEMSFFLKSTTPEDDFALEDNTGGTDKNDLHIRDTKVIHLPVDSEMQFSSPNQPISSHESFVDSCLKEISSSVEISRDLLTKVFDSSYSSSTAGSQDLMRTVGRERESIIDDILTPIYNLFVEHLWLDDKVVMPGFDSRRADYQKVRWVAKGRDSINPRNDLASTKAMIEMGLKSKTQAIAEYNNATTFEEINEELAYENSLTPAVQDPMR